MTFSLPEVYLLVHRKALDAFFSSRLFFSPSISNPLKVLFPSGGSVNYYIIGARMHRALSSPSQSTTSCTSSSSAAASSSGAAETDGQEGDDEGEEDLRLKSIVDKSKFAFFFGSIFYCY